MSQSPGRYDVVVVGAGVNGLSTAWRLLELRPSCRLAVVEQFPIPHSRGSSHGHTRIIRMAYHDSRYSRLMLRAYPLWRQLQQCTGSQLMLQCGMACFGDEATTRTYQESMVSCGAEYQILDAAATRQRFPAFGGFGTGCVLDTSAGVLMADRCLAALRARIRQLGGDILDSSGAESVLPASASADGVARVRLTTGQSLAAAKVVLAAGSWAGQLLRQLGLRLPLTPKAVTVMYWQHSQPADPSILPASMPTFIADMPDVRVYGLPCIEYPGLVKICYHDGEEIDPDRREDTAPTLPYLPKMVQFVRRFFPALQTPPAIVEKCIYTMTPDKGLIVDKHPKHPEILFICGCSGHGFKLGPVIGQLVAEMALDMAASEDSSFMSASRFADTAAARL